MKNILQNILILICLGLLFSNPYKPLDIDFLKQKPKKKSPLKKQEQKTKKENPNSFLNIIKDYEKIEGLFTFYVKDDINQVYIELTPEQFNVLYMMNVTRETGDGTMLHGVSMQGEFPFYFKKNGNIIQLIEKNVKFRAGDNSETSKALKNQIPDSKIKPYSVSPAHPHHSGDQDPDQFS